MLKKLLTGALAASAMAVPLAGVVAADPSTSPNPPAAPNANAQNLVNPNGPAAPASGQGPANAAAPAVTGPQTPACVVSANTPAQGPPGTTWLQVTTLQGSLASELGLSPGQTMSVYCAPAGAPNVAEQPTGVGNPGQTNPQQNAVQNQPGRQGLQNTSPDQH
jgi:hypothetical protein